jgi:hypothetical protein
LCIKGMLEEKQLVLCLPLHSFLHTSMSVSAVLSRSDEILAANCTTEYHIKRTHKEYSRRRHNIRLQGHLHAPTN